MKIISEKFAHERFVRTLLGRTDVETCGIMLAEPQPAGETRRLVVREYLHVPDDAYLIRARDQLRIDSVALNRLTRRARDRGLSVLMVHTHPGASRAWFSGADDDGDARLLPALAAHVPDVPHGSLVLVDSGEMIARVLYEGTVHPADVFTIGTSLNVVSAMIADGDEPWFARQTLALGPAGHATLRRLRVGVVGLGGIGSVVTVQLAHLGVGDLVLVDGDVVEDSNVSRIVGARTGDAGALKAEVMARYVRSIGLSVKVSTVPSFLRGGNDVDLLRGCDVVVACVDRHTPRSLLNRMAYESCLPVIDAGVAFRVDSGGQVVGDSGRVVVLGPGRRCLACWGHIDPEALRREALDEESGANETAAGYIDGAEVAQPAVISFNTTVAGTAVTELLRLVTQFGGVDAAPERLSFSFRQGIVRRNTLAGDGRCRICSLP